MKRKYEVYDVWNTKGKTICSRTLRWRIFIILNYGWQSPKFYFQAMALEEQNFSIPAVALNDLRDVIREKLLVLQHETKISHSLHQRDDRRRKKADTSIVSKWVRWLVNSGQMSIWIWHSRTVLKLYAERRWVMTDPLVPICCSFRT